MDTTSSLKVIPFAKHHYCVHHEKLLSRTKQLLYKGKKRRNSLPERSSSHDVRSYELNNNTKKNRFCYISDCSFTPLTICSQYLVPPPLLPSPPPPLTPLTNASMSLLPLQPCQFNMRYIHRMHQIVP